MKKLLLPFILLAVLACSKESPVDTEPIVDPTIPTYIGNILRVGEGQEYTKFPDAIKNAIPGDVIILHPGRYDGDGRYNYYSNLRGEEGKPITIMAEKEGTASFYGKYGLWLLRQTSYIDFINVTFENQEGNFVNVDDGGALNNTPSHHIRFVNCTFKDLNRSITDNADLLKMSGVDHFEVINCTFKNGAGGSGIDMVGCHHGLIKGCYFEETGMNAIQVKGGSQYVRIEGNFMKNCGDRNLNLGGQTGIDYFRPYDAKFEAADIEVYSNIMIGTYSPVAFVGCIRTTVANNTIVDPEHFVVRILQERENPNRFIECGDNYFINNIIYRSNSVARDCNIGDYTNPDSFVFANNLWYNYENPKWNGPTNIPVLDEDKIVGKDPMFKNVAKEDFTLLPGSPAIGKGRLVTELKNDFTGKPFASPRSIGAYEK